MAFFWVILFYLPKSFRVWFTHNRKSSCYRLGCTTTGMIYASSFFFMQLRSYLSHFHNACYHPHDGLVWKLTSPQGSPSIPRASSPRGIHPRGVQHAPLKVHCMGISSPGEPNIPAESCLAYTHRGAVPVLISLARLLEVERECRRRLISSSKAPTSRRQPPLPVSLQSPPPFAGDSPVLIPPASPCPSC